MHNIKTNFDEILEVFKSILPGKVDLSGNFQRLGTKAKFSDSVIISLSLTSEYLSVNSEKSGEIMPKQL